MKVIRGLTKYLRRVSKLLQIGRSHFEVTSIFPRFRICNKKYISIPNKFGQTTLLPLEVLQKSSDPLSVHQTALPLDFIKCTPMSKQIVTLQKVAHNKFTDIIYLCRSCVSFTIEVVPSEPEMRKENMILSLLVILLVYDMQTTAGT